MNSHKNIIIKSLLNFLLFSNYRFWCRLIDPVILLIKVRSFFLNFFEYVIEVFYITTISDKYFYYFELINDDKRCFDLSLNISFSFDNEYDDLRRITNWKQCWYPSKSNSKSPKQSPTQQSYRFRHNIRHGLCLHQNYQRRLHIL